MKFKILTSIFIVNALVTSHASETRKWDSMLPQEGKFNAFARAMNEDLQYALHNNPSLKQPTKAQKSLGRIVFQSPALTNHAVRTSLLIKADNGKTFAVFPDNENEKDIRGYILKLLKDGKVRFIEQLHGKKVSYYLPQGGQNTKGVPDREGHAFPVAYIKEFLNDKKINTSVKKEKKKSVVLPPLFSISEEENVESFPSKAAITKKKSKTRHKSSIGSSKKSLNKKKTVRTTEVLEPLSVNHD